MDFCSQIHSPAIITQVTTLPISIEFADSPTTDVDRDMINLKANYKGTPNLAWPTKQFRSQ